MPDIVLNQENLELPVELAGFSVEIFAGPYPIDAPHSHRRAVYARLRPLEEHLARRLRWIGRSHILGEAQLDARTARLLAANQLPEVELEQLALAALRPALKLARKVRGEQ